MALVHITSVQDFEEKVEKAGHPVLVDFFATWCGPCKMVSGEVEALAPEMEGKATIVKIDVEVVPDLAKRFKVMSVPTLLVVKGTEEVSRAVGFRPRTELAAMIEKAL